MRLDIYVARLIDVNTSSPSILTDTHLDLTSMDAIDLLKLCMFFFLLPTAERIFLIANG